MATWRALLKPDWRRAMATLLMVALLVAAYIQAFAFVDDVPGASKPPLYDRLLPFAFWAAGMMLILPLALVCAPLAWLGVSILSSPLIWPLQILYLYVLSCLLVFGHDDWMKDLASRWRWLVVAVPIGVTFALWLPDMLSVIRSAPQMILFLGSSALLSGCVLAVYAYVAVGVGLAIRRRFRAGKKVVD